MPNWVQTKLHFYGEDTNIKKVMDKIIVDGEFDFNTLIPKPEELDLISGSVTDIAIYVFLSNKGELNKEETIAKAQELNVTMSMYTNVNNEDFTQENYELGEKYVNNVVNYGHKTWYEWSIDNWGTKWNSCHTYQDLDILEFETAWSFPHPIMEELARLCTMYNVEFSGCFCDEDCFGGNLGKFNNTSGELDVSYEIDLTEFERIDVIGETYGLWFIEEGYNFETKEVNEEYEWIIQEFSPQGLEYIYRHYM